MGLLSPFIWTKKCVNSGANITPQQFFDVGACHFAEKYWRATILEFRTRCSKSWLGVESLYMLQQMQIYMDFQCWIHRYDILIASRILGSGEPFYSLYPKWGHVWKEMCSVWSYEMMYSYRKACRIRVWAMNWTYTVYIRMVDYLGL